MTLDYFDRFEHDFQREFGKRAVAVGMPASVEKQTTPPEGREEFTKEAESSGV